MLFRNLSLYRLAENFSLTASELEEALSRRPLKPCGSFDLQSRGFVHCGYEQRFLYTQGRHHLVALGVEQKLLPASVVNDEAKERARELEEQQGHPVGRRQMRDLKTRVAEELRARAFVRRRTTQAWIDLDARLVLVDAATAARAEEVIDTLRDALGSLPAQPATTGHSPAGAMAAWLGHGDAPGRFTLEQDLELTAIDGGGATVRYSRHPLDTGEIRAHLESGKKPTRLGLTWNDRISFVLHQNLQLKRVQFLDVYKDDNAQGENPHEQFDIDFALLTGEVSQLVAELATILGDFEWRPEGESDAAAAAKAGGRSAAASSRAPEAVSEAA